MTGLVKNATTDAPLAGVRVEVSNAEGTAYTPTISGDDGSFELSLPSGSYVITYTKTGYLAEVQYGVVVERSQTTIIESILQIDEAFAGLGDITGRVTNAVDGSPVAGASIEIRRGVGATAGDLAAATVTNASGSYQVTGLEAGNYTVTAAATGFISSSYTITVLGNQTNLVREGSLSPVLSQGEVRIVLTWGATPTDLDSHLTGPSETGGRFHVFFNQRAPTGAGAFLDLDDVTSFGPETVTITDRVPGLYRYSVHDYSNRSQTSSTAMGRSGARVRVFLAGEDGGSQQIADLNVPNQAGTLWTVFEMTVAENGELSFAVVNSLSYTSAPGSVNRSAQGPETDAYLLLDLPAKGK